MTAYLNDNLTMNTQMWTSDDEIFSSSKPQVSLPNDEFEDLLSSVFDGPEGEAFMVSSAESLLLYPDPQTKLTG